MSHREYVGLGYCDFVGDKGWCELQKNHDGRHGVFTVDNNDKLTIERWDE